MDDEPRRLPDSGFPSTWPNEARRFRRSGAAWPSRRPWRRWIIPEVKRDRSGTERDWRRAESARCGGFGNDSSGGLGFYHVLPFGYVKIALKMVIYSGFTL